MNNPVTGMNKTAHAPTLVYALGALIVLLALYHITLGRKH